MEGKLHYHNCGYPILIVQVKTDNLETIRFVDGHRPENIRKNGSRTMNVLVRCPKCSSIIKPDRLSTRRPRQ